MICLPDMVPDPRLSDAGDMAKRSERIGPSVRRLRLARGMTQRELAEAADCADPTLSRIERGRLVPSVELANRIAAALEVGVDDLFSAKQDKPTLRKSEARLLAAVRGLDDAAVDDVARAVKLIIAASRR